MVQVSSAAASSVPIDRAIEVAAEWADEPDSDRDSNIDDAESDASSHSSDMGASPSGAASAADEARVAASAAAHAGRAIRRAERTAVGVGCVSAGCSSTAVRSSRDGLTWMLIQRGNHTGHRPGVEESNAHLPLPAEWESAAAAGVSIEGEDPAQAANHYLDDLHKARLSRDTARVYSDLEGLPLPGFSRSDPASSPGGVFRARGGHHSVSMLPAVVAEAEVAAGPCDSPAGLGTNAPFFCICGQPRGTALDGPLVRCTRARTCPRGGVFHLATVESPEGCVQQVDLDAEGNYTCLSCKAEEMEEAVRADLQDDAAVAASFVAVTSADVRDEADAGDLNVLGLNRRLADARAARSLPTHATAFRSWCTPTEVSDLRAARNRAKRGGIRISGEYVPLLEQ